MDLPIDSSSKTLNIPYSQHYEVNLEDESYQQQRDLNKGGGSTHRTLLIGVQTGQPQCIHPTQKTIRWFSLFCISCCYPF